jgi:hypothetical protein
LKFNHTKDIFGIVKIRGEGWKLEIEDEENGVGRKQWMPNGDRRFAQIFSSASAKIT